MRAHKRLVFVGLGGNSFGPLAIGLHLAHKHPDLEVVLVDGKSYKPTHADHEFFLRPGPKAHVQALLLNNAYPNLHVVPVTTFVDRTTSDNAIAINELLNEGDYIILVVDNHETRRLVTEHVMTMQDATLISGAVDGDDVGIWVHLRRQGRDLMTPPLTRYPDIKAAHEQLPSAMFDRTGCIEEGLQTTDKPEPRPNYFALLSTTMLTLNALWLAMELDDQRRTNEFPYVDTWLNVRTATANPNQNGAQP